MTSRQKSAKPKTINHRPVRMPSGPFAFSDAVTLVSYIPIRFDSSIPKGLCNSAHGCEERATLGNGGKIEHNPERVAAACPWTLGKSAQ
jgi:hypothetical protein